jgi:hypothetical protein
MLMRVQNIRGDSISINFHQSFSQTSHVPRALETTICSVVSQDESSVRNAISTVSNTIEAAVVKSYI